MVLHFPFEFIGFGAMDCNLPYEFIGFGATDCNFPYEFIGFLGGRDGRIDVQVAASIEAAR